MRPDLKCRGRKNSKKGKPGLELAGSGGRRRKSDERRGGSPTSGIYLREREERVLFIKNRRNQKGKRRERRVVKILKNGVVFGLGSV